MLDFVINLLVHLSALLGVILVILVTLRAQSSKVRTAFIILIGTTVIWSLGTLLELDARLITGQTVMAFINICYVGICFMPISLLNMSIVVFKNDINRKLAHLLFLLIPVLSIIMVFTNPLHGLFFAEFSIFSSEAVYGSYYYFHSLYSYACIAVAIVVLYVASARNSGYFSRQSFLVIAGIVITLVPNMLYSFDIVELPFSISAAASSFSILLFSIAFLKYRFVETLPVTLRQIVNLISDSYLVLDKRLSIISFNHALLRMFPDKSVIALGKGFKPFFERNFPNTPFDDIYMLYKQVIIRCETSSIELLSSDGAFIRMEITPVTRRPALIGSIVLMKDITESKKLLEMSQAASKAKGDFLSQMSHEIRTPLNAIIGMIYIGQCTDDISKMKYCFSRADGASKHLLSILNDILDISKIEADKLELSYSEIELMAMIDKITNIAIVRAEEKKLRFSVEINESVPSFIVTDELRLTQAIMNLLTNAIKFTAEDGSVVLTIDVLEEQGEDVTLRFEVADSGIGISKEQQSGLFDSYKQASANITKSYGGTGLGLAITKQIVLLMGGDIHIESELGQGAKFIFTIKARKIDGMSDETAAVMSYPDSCAPRGYDFSDYKLLIVEDVEINREIIAAILEETNVSIDFAENGEIAVSMFERDPYAYNMILMDIQMPVMDGYESTKAIRSLDLLRAKEVPIVAMTASVFKEDIERCIACGMDDHTGKPIDTAALLGMINKYLTAPKKTRGMQNIYVLENGVAWDDSLLTGNALVDMQHQRIFSWASSLVDSCEGGNDTAMLWDTLEFIGNYSIRHFTDEEALQIECGYPQYEDHRKKHDEFKEIIVDFLNRFKEEGPSEQLSQDVNRTVAKWLVQHVQTEDAKLSEHIRSIAQKNEGVS